MQLQSETTPEDVAIFDLGAVSEQTEGPSGPFPDSVMQPIGLLAE
jgi:hypothetical protein